MKITQTSNVEIGDSVDELVKKLNGQVGLFFLYTKDGKVCVTANPGLPQDLVVRCLDAVGRIIEEMDITIVDIGRK